MAEDLIVLQKTYDMIQYGYQCLRQYPKLVGIEVIEWQTGTRR